MQIYRWELLAICHHTDSLNYLICHVNSHEQVKKAYVIWWSLVYMSRDLKKSDD